LQPWGGALQAACSGDGTVVLDERVRGVGLGFLFVFVFWF
jgi:hypothetical protein